MGIYIYDVMHFSHYLEKAVFFEQSPAASQLFEEKTDQLFEKSSERSYVEIHVQSPFQSQLKHDLPGSPISPDSSYVDLSVDFQFKSSTVLDPNFDCQEEPPGYVGSRRSQTPHLVKDTTTLTRIAAVSCSTRLYASQSQSDSGSRIRPHRLESGKYRL